MRWTDCGHTLTLEANFGDTPFLLCDRKSTLCFCVGQTLKEGKSLLLSGDSIAVCLR